MARRSLTANRTRRSRGLLRVVTSGPRSAVGKAKGRLDMAFGGGAYLCAPIRGCPTEIRSSYRRHSSNVCICPITKWHRTVLGAGPAEELCFGN